MPGVSSEEHETSPELVDVLLQPTRDRPVPLQRLRPLPQLSVNVLQEAERELRIDVTDECQPVGELVGERAAQEVRRLGQPAGEGVAAARRDRVGGATRVLAFGVGDRRDPAGGDQALELPIDVADAEPYAGTFGVRLHQGIAVGWSTIRE